MKESVRLFVQMVVLVVGGDSYSCLFMGNVKPVVVAACAADTFVDFVAVAGCVRGLVALAFPTCAALDGKEPVILLT